jgi:hypothetical protein
MDNNQALAQALNMVIKAMTIAQLQSRLTLLEAIKANASVEDIKAIDTIDNALFAYRETLSACLTLLDTLQLNDDVAYLNRCLTKTP